MRILVVTGSLAYDMAKDVVSSIRGHEVEVCRLSHPVASLMTATYIARELAGRVNRKYDYVLIPGLALGDASVIKPVVGCKVFKGPRYLGDLPEVIKLLESGVELSTTLPADEVLEGVLKEAYESRVGELFKRASYAFSLGSLGVPLRSPPLLLAYEVMLRSGSEYGNVLGRVRRACELGVDIVVIGSSVNSYVPLSVVDRLVGDVKYGFGRAVGVDLPPDDARRLDSEFDLILNASYGALESLTGFRDRGVVIVPSDTSSVDSCRESLAKTVGLARRLGFAKVVVDPILRPPQLGLAESLAAYYHVSRELSCPLMMGASNVYELIDSDSHSIIALLTSIAVELGVSVLLLTEESVKSHNAVAEAVRARNMVYRAYVRRSPPVNVDVDLLIVKEKRRRDVGPPGNCLGGVDVSEPALPPSATDRYYFRVYVDRENKHIVVDTHELSSGRCVRRYVGTSALALCRRIASDHREAISGEHYAYLGYELCKAELALRLGRSYVQDEPVISLGVSK